MQDYLKQNKRSIFCSCGEEVSIPTTLEEYYATQDNTTVTRNWSRESKEKATKHAEDFIREAAVQPTYDDKSTYAINMLHLSDLHLGTPENAKTYLRHLESDLKNNLNVEELEYLIISGDIANFSLSQEYDAAYELIDGLVKSFRLTPSRIIMVPGNHDLNWEISEDSYNKKISLRKLPNEFNSEHAIPYTDGGRDLKGYFIRDDEVYEERFDYFRAFYKKVCGKSYPLDPSEQAILHNFSDRNIQFLCLNSCAEIDHAYPKRSGINQQALNYIHQEVIENRYKNWLKIAVWHHPVTGSDGMNNTGFLEQLMVWGFQVGMHGHIHEAQNNSFRYDDSHGLQIIGAGTFGASAHEQVTGIPLQYNLIQFDTEKRDKMVIHTRRKEKPDGVWAADSRWGDKLRSPEPYYTILIK